MLINNGNGTNIGNCDKDNRNCVKLVINKRPLCKRYMLKNKNGWILDN